MKRWTGWVSACFLVLLALAQAPLERAGLGGQFLPGEGFSPVQSSLTGQDDRDATQKMVGQVLDGCSKSLVGVEITLKKKSRLEQMEEDQESDGPYALQEARELRQSVDLFGVAVDDKGTLIVPDTGLPLDDIESVRMITQEGETVEAEVAAVLKNYAGLVVKPTKDATIHVTPVEFKDAGDFPAGSYYYAVTMDTAEGSWQVNVTPYIVTNRSLPKTAQPGSPAAGGLFIMDPLHPGALVADRTGQPVGLAMDTYLWRMENGRNSFAGGDILKDERIAIQDLREQYKQIEAALLKAAVKIEIDLRQDRSDASAYLRAGSDPRSSKIIHFGIPIGDGTDIFVPRDLDQEIVRKIEDIRLIDGADEKHAVTFRGLLKDLGGYLLKSDTMKLTPASLNVQERELQRGQLFFTVQFEEKFGKPSADVKHNRAAKMVKGLYNKMKVQPLSSIPAGAFLVDSASAFIGFCTTEKKEEELGEHTFSRFPDSYAARSYSRVREDLRKLFLFGPLQETLSQPEKHFDKLAVPQSTKAEKSLVWLGVEFQEIGKPLADELGVQKQTRDGKKGLLVTDVYPGSPAQKLSIKPDDILLSLRVDETGETIDLVLDERGAATSSLDHYYTSRRYSDDPVPPWRTRRNYLSTLLTKIGAGKKATLTTLRDKKEQAVALTLETALPDYESADRYKDDDLGFTVRELTYEVRYYQKLSPDYTGVIVSRVESGGRAEVAKLAPLTIIRSVNHERVQSLEQFKKLLESFKSSKLKSLTIELVNLGQSRFVDILRE